MKYHNIERSIFWKSFIPDAPTWHISNRCVERGFSNGVPIKSYSVIFKNQQRKQQFIEEFNSASVGSFISLEQPPDY